MLPIRFRLIHVSSTGFNTLPTSLVDHRLLDQHAPNAPPIDRQRVRLRQLSVIVQVVPQTRKLPHIPSRYFAILPAMQMLKYSDSSHATY